MRYDLLIVYDDDGTKAVINQVTEYGYREQGAMFYFVKDLINSFIPSSHVLFFGLKRQWGEVECYE